MTAPDTDRDRSDVRPWAVIDSRRGSLVVLAAGLLAAVGWWTWLGSKRWFHADDWSYLLYRNVFDSDGSLSSRLFQPHNGHPVVLPALQFSVTSRLFDWSSYVPYVMVAVALHVVCGLLLWRIVRRVGVSDLTAVVVTLATLLIGAAAEFPTFASISSYQYSLIGLLISVIVLYRYDDDSPLIYVASAVGMVTALSSSFVVVFAIAIAIATFGQRRWRAGIVVLGPQLTLYGWWWVAWGRDRPADQGSMFDAPRWAVIVLHRLFEGLAGPNLGALALVATAIAGIALCPPGRARATIVWPMAAAAAAGALLVGAQRSDLGTADVATGRYVVVFAFLVAPALAVAVDASRKVGAPVFVVVVASIVVAMLVNLSSWRVNQLAVAEATHLDQHALALVAGSDTTGIPRDHQPSRCSPDIRIADLPMLIDHGAITPQLPAGEADEELLAASIGMLPNREPDIRPCTPDR